MSLQQNLGSYQIQPKTFRFERDKMLDVIRELSFVRIGFPVGPSIPVWQRETQYFDITEQDNIQYNLDLVAPNYSRFSAQEKRPAVPIHQGDLEYKRHEVQALGSDILTLDRRQRETLAQMVNDEERVGWAGDAKTGITSFANTTDNSTAATAELDLTSYTTAITTWTNIRSQLRTLLKSQFRGPDMTVWTSDVDDRAEVVLNTDQNDTFKAWLERKIGAENIIVTNFLGSETAAGTINMGFYKKDPMNLELMTSGLEVVSGLSELKDLKVQLALRSRPIFYRGVKSAIYSGTVDITA